MSTTWTVGAGSGDNFTSLQAALASASVLAGDTIQIAPGVYTHTGSLLINKDVTITGMGGDMGDVVIRSAGAVPGKEDSSVQITASGVTIENVTFTGWETPTTNAKAGFGYLVWNTGNNTTFDHVGFAADNIRVAVYIGTSNGITITDSHFTGDLYRTAIRGAGEHMTITDNVFQTRHYENGPIYFEYGAPMSGVISGNVFEHTFGVTKLAPDASGPFKSDGTTAYTITNWQPNKITSDGLVIEDNTFHFMNADAVNPVTGASPQPAAIYNDPLVPAGGPIVISGNSFVDYDYDPPPLVLPAQENAGVNGTGALRFDGKESYASFTMPANIGSEGTLSFWVKLDSDATGHRNQILEGPGEGKMEFQYREKTGGQFFGTPNNANSNGENVVIQSTGAATTASQNLINVQYVWKFSGGTSPDPTTAYMSIYINGVEVSYLAGYDDALQTWTSVVASTLGTFYLGKDATTNDRMLDGWLDDLAIFSTALDQSQRDAVRTNSAGINTNNYNSLVAYWDFNDAINDTTIESKGGTNVVLNLHSLKETIDPAVVVVNGGTAGAVVTGNSFDGDGTALRGTNVTADGNWWNTTDPVEIDARIDGTIPFNAFLASGTDLDPIAPGFQSSAISGDNSPNNLVGTPDADALFGFGGNDTIKGLGNDDSIDGGTGIDKALYDGVVTPNAIASTDTGWTVAVPGEGTDTLTEVEIVDGAEPGKIFLVGGTSSFATAADALASSEWQAGDSIQIATGGANGNVTVDLSAQSQSINITTGGGNDNISTGSGKDRVQTNGGNDVVRTGAGDDTVIGGSGAGNDYYDAGTHVTGDTIIYSSATNSVTIDLTELNRSADLIVAAILSGASVPTGTPVGKASGVDIGVDALVGFENATGGGGDDDITGNSGANVLDGGGGSDTVYFRGSASDGIATQSSATTLVVDGSSGGDGTDTLVNVEKIVFQGGTTATGDDVTIRVVDGNATVYGRDDTATAVEASGVANATPGTNPTGNVLTNDINLDEVAGSSISADVKRVTLARKVGGTDVVIVNGVTIDNTQVDVAGAYGTLKIAEDGSYQYVVTQSLVDSKNVGDTPFVDKFVYTVDDGSGNPREVLFDITITPVNDAATITGTSTGTVVEAGGENNGTAGTPTATGNLEAADVDNTADAWQPIAAGTAATYGTYGMTAAGVWTYTLDDTNPIVQSLYNGGAPLLDMFTAQTVDGTSKTVMVTITGANDEAVITVLPVSANESDLASFAMFNVADRVTIADVDVDDAGHGVGYVAGSGSVTVSPTSPAPPSGALLDFLSLNANSGFVVYDRSSFNWLKAGQTVEYTIAFMAKSGNDAPQPKTLTVTIKGENDAPVLTTDTHPVLNTIGEHDLGNPGQTVASFRGPISDADTGALKGIAITAKDTGNGHWEFSTDGGTTWDWIGTVSEGAALLLRDTDKVKFVPNNTSGTTGTLTYHAWDQTTGSPGGVGDITTIGTGGKTAFSTATDTATITVLSVNDAPDAGDNTGTATEAGGTLNATAGVPATGNVLGNDTDPDGNALTVSAVRTGSGTAGALSVGLVGEHGTLTLNADGTYTYVVNETDPAVQVLKTGTLTDSFTYTVRDPGGLTDTAALTITINGANDAPVAVNDAGTATEAGGAANGTAGTPATGNVRTNDTDVDDATSSLLVTSVRADPTEGSGTAGIVGGAAVGLHGTLTLSANGAYTYTVTEGDSAVQALKVGETITDIFNYTIGDGSLSDIGVLTITINGANDAPTASNLSQPLTVVEDTASTPLGIVVSDVDAGDTITATLTLADTAAGSLSTAGGGSYNAGVWTITGSLATVNAALAAVTFVPAPNANINTTIKTHIEDAAGAGPVNGTIAVTMTAVNDAPVLGATSPALDPIDENAVANGGQSVGSFAGATISDVDTSAVKGIAITDLGGAHGHWEYWISGGTSWVAIGTVSETSALLLRDIDLVRFKPDGENGTAATLTYRAWDQTGVDTAGTKVSTATNGGATAFSTATTTATLAVADVNDTATITVAPGVTDTESNLPSFVSFLIKDKVSISDVDLDDTAVPHGYVAGSGSVSIATGQPTPPSGTLADLLTFDAASGTVLYDRSAFNWLSGGQTVQYKINFQAQSGDDAAQAKFITVTISGENDAPVLTTGTHPVLTTIGEHDTTNTGQMVASFRGPISDADAGASTGIAIYAADSGNGKWQFSTNGGADWSDFNTISVSQSLLLRDTDFVRFVPNNTSGTTGSLSYRAWDQTTAELAGAKVSTASNGGSTPFSAATDTATIAVLAVNDAPDAGDNVGTATEAGGTLNATAGAPATGNVLGNDTDPDGNALTVSAVRTGSGTAGAVSVGLVGAHGTLTLNADGTYTYVVNENDPAVQALKGGTLTDSFSYTVRDPGGLTDTALLTITINGANDAPVAVDDAGSATEAGGTNNGVAGSDATGNVLGNDTDVDDAPSSLTVTAVRTGPVDGAGTAGTLGTELIGLHGKLTLTADGNYTYVVNETDSAVQGLKDGQTITDTFNYTVTDGGLSDTAVLTITINGANDIAKITTSSVWARESNLPSFNTFNVADKVTILDVDTDDAPHGYVAGSGTVTVTSGPTPPSGTLADLLTFDAATGTVLYDRSAFNWLSAGQKVVYTIDFDAQSGDEATQAQCLTVTIKGDNDAPVLTTGTHPTLTTIDEHDVDNPGQTVASFLGPVSDADFGALKGIAITAVDNGNGHWEFSIDGGACWTCIDAVDDCSALLLRDTDLVRFVPNDEAGTTGTLTYRAWDQTCGDAGCYFDTVPNGGTTAFSAATDTATITVLPVNDPPIAQDNTGTAVEASGVFNTTPGSTATGNVLANDADDGGQDALVITAVRTGGESESGLGGLIGGTLKGAHGTLNLNEDGSYTYTVDENDLAVQALNVDDEITDTFTYTTRDLGNLTDKAELVITIEGRNDNAVISGADTGGVTEKSGVLNATAGIAEVTGDLDATDVDSSADFVEQDTVAKAYGHFSIDASGAWTYTLDDDNEDVQELNVGGTLHDTFTVETADGTTHEIDITINGANDAAVITGTPTGEVKEKSGVFNATPGVKTVIGNLDATDVDNSADFAEQDTVAKAYGHFSIDATGAWTYTLNDDNEDVQALNVGGTLHDKFNVKTVDGTTREIDITIKGANDAAMISGGAAGAVTEKSGSLNSIAGVATVTGDLNATDVDNSADFEEQDSVAKAYGHFSIDATGAWSYTLDDTNGDVQALNVGGTLQDTFLVATADGTTKTIEITINGANDAAVITGSSTGSVIEKSGVLNATPGVATVIGDLNATDVDSPANFVTQTDLAKTYGRFSIGGTGDWTYTVDDNNAAVQALNNGGTLHDTFTVATADGTTKTIDITINGVNDAAVITGNATGAVTEKSGALNGTLGVAVATGDLDATDVDNPATFAVLSNTPTNYGRFSIDATGAWAYTLDDTNTSVQALNVGGTLHDTFQVATADGTTKTIDITINGANDSAVVTGDSTGVVSEKGGVANGTAGVATVSGDLNATDVDSAANFIAQANAAKAYGRFSIDSSGTWTYSLDDTNASVQALNVGGTLHDQVTVSTADGTTQFIDITINGANDAATITGTSIGTVTEKGGVLNGTAGVAVASGDLDATDVDNAPAFVAQTNVAKTYGRLSIDASGAWTYTLDDTNASVQALNAGGTLHDQFTVTTVDGTARQFDIAINGVDDSPVVSAPVVLVAAKEDTPRLITKAELLANASDVDGGTMQVLDVAIAAGKGSVTDNNDGTWTFKPAQDDDTDVTLSYKVSDGIAPAVVATATLDITPVNDTPVSQAEIVTGNEDVTIAGTLQATDVDGQTLTYSLVTQAQNGVATINASGGYTYKPNANFSGIDHFTYQAFDGSSASTATIDLSITSVNDAPVNVAPNSIVVEAGLGIPLSGFSVIDVDAGNGTMTTILTVGHGSLTIGAVGGVGVSGSGSTTVTLTGTLAQINAALAASQNVIYRTDATFTGDDTVTVVTWDNGNAGSGGSLSDTDQVALAWRHFSGTSGSESYTALPGYERIDAGGGVDTVTFNFRLVDATFTWSGNQVIVDTPTSHTILTGVEKFAFVDGTVDNADGDPLVDDLFYYATYRDVWSAHIDADAHYHQYGWHEWRDPSAFFSTSFYLATNSDVKAASIDPLVHFDTAGWKEGRTPSTTFDAGKYLAANPDVAAIKVDPLAHFMQYGAGEGRQPFAVTELLASNGFDYVYYLRNNPDVAAAHVDPFLHFQTIGWKEGRNPNALFDTNGYLATYSDVKNSGGNPLDHYHQFGWTENRDPSKGFDTSNYLLNYSDVALAHIDPLKHFLQAGIHEGRSPFGDGVWG